MNLLISPSTILDIKELIDLKVNSFLLGIKHLSLYHNFYVDINEIKTILKAHKNIELFVSVNKIMHNSDLDLLNKTLIELNKLNIKGVLYDDVAILNIVTNLKLNINLIWAGTHIVTNYHAINTLKDNVGGALISSELTIKEILTIKENTNKLIFVSIFGHQIMTTSKRTLVTNYLNFIKKDVKEDLYYIKDNNCSYPIIEDESGTHILTSKVLNGIKEMNLLKEHNIDYLYLSSYNLNSELFNKVVAVYQKKINDIDVNNSDIDTIISNNDTFFFYKESYFKVGDNDEV